MLQMAVITGTGNRATLNRQRQRNPLIVAIEGGVGTRQHHPATGCGERCGIDLECYAWIAVGNMSSGESLDCTITVPPVLYGC